MKTIIIVSKCMKVVKIDKLENLYHFHFKGVCAGESLQKVILRGRKDFSIRKGEEYLMYVQMISFADGVLQGRILKIRPLEECWDRS